MFVSGGKTTERGIDEQKDLIPIFVGKDNLPMRFASPTLSCDTESAALRTEIMALRRSDGDADPGVVIRLARQRVAAATTILEMKAMVDEVAEFRHHLETLRLALHLERLRAEYKANFDPDQPRDEYGRWTDGGGEAPDGTPIELAADRRRATWPVDLLDEEDDRGGHTIEKHVGKSADALIRRLESETYVTLFGTVYLPATGSFVSLESANKLVNSTLSENPTLVSLIASGRLKLIAVEREFSSITGIEAYRSSSRSEPYIRDTYGVRVVIFHDKTLSRGFRIKTAFPIRSRR